MDGWPYVVDTIVVDDVEYTIDNIDDLHINHLINEMNSIFIIPDEDGNLKEIRCYTEDKVSLMNKWLKQNHEKLYRNLGIANMVRDTLRNMLIGKFPKKKTFMEWFCSVQVKWPERLTDLGMNTELSEEACSWIYNIPGCPPPPPKDSSNSLHLQNGASIPDLSCLPRGPPNTSNNWFHQIRSVEVCGGPGSGLRLFQGKYFSQLDIILTGPPIIGGTKKYPTLNFGGNLNFDLNTASLQDLQV